MRNYNYEISCAVISSFFDNEKYLNEPYFRLDSKVFIHPFHKMLAERINQAVNNNESLSLLELRLSEWIDTQPKKQQLWLDIISQQGFTMITARKYYEKLEDDYFKRLQEELVK